MCFSKFPLNIPSYYQLRKCSKMGTFCLFLTTYFVYILYITIKCIISLASAFRLLLTMHIHIHYIHHTTIRTTIHGARTTIYTINILCVLKVEMGYVFPLGELGQYPLSRHFVGVKICVSFYLNRLWLIKNNLICVLEN